MRTQLLFDDIDATLTATSSVIDFNKEQRGEWLLSCRASGINKKPRIIIEYSIDNAGVRFDQIIDPDTGDAFFEFDSNGELAVRDTAFQGSRFRIRLDPNGETAGTILADFGFKTFP